MKKAILWLMICLLPVMLAACSSGGGGGGGGTTSDATALTVASQVSVVDAKLTGSVAGVAPLKLSWAGIMKALSDVPANSDYNNDQPNVYVQERSVEAFNTVNEILCMMAQTKYDAMLNKGAYTAQLDAKQCSSSNSDASSAGQASTNQSSGSDAPQYEMWTVNSTRADDTSPQYVKVWIHEKARDSYDQDKTILVKVTITEGKSATNPIGIFTVNFKGVSPANPSIVRFWGTLKSERDLTGKILLKFAEEESPEIPGGNPRYKQYATLDKATDGSDSGAGKVYRYENWNNQADESTFNVAFNANFFLRTDATGTAPDVCLNRNAFDQSAWQYGLYNDTTGARITRNSGFPIQVGTAYGWVGYWGLWLPDNVTVANGNTVNKHDYQSNTNTPYTVFKSNGKLKKHTKKSLTLADIKNIPLNYGVCSGGPCINYQVVWNGSAFRVTAQQDQTNWTWTNITPYDLDLSVLQWTELNFWSQALGGQLRVKLPTPQWNVTPTGNECSFDNMTGKWNCTGKAISTTPVVFYAEDIVYPDDATLAATVSFTCFDNCPNADTSAGVNTTNPFLPYLQSGYTYTFNKSAMMLTYLGNDVVQTAAIANWTWGVMTGALFNPAATVTDTLDPNYGKTYQQLLACDWDPNQICGYKAWSELPVFYTWETGLNDWNKFVALKDGSNAFVTFDPPLQVEYIHSQATTTAPDYKYNGTKFYLDYSGFGQLNGIPGKCVDDGGNAVSCNNNTRWVPEFMIPAGSTVTAGSASYLAKPLNIEQRMSEDTTGGCALLHPGIYTLPTLADWVDPSTGSDPVTAANDPTATITVPPAVIGGVVQ